MFHSNPEVEFIDKTQKSSDIISFVNVNAKVFFDGMRWVSKISMPVRTWYPVSKHVTWKKEVRNTKARRAERSRRRRW